MKYILLILAFVCLSYSVEYSTNTEMTINNVEQKATEWKFFISDWGREIDNIKENGFTILSAISILILFLISLIILGSSLAILLNLVKLFTPQKIDEKIDKIENVIISNLIELPINILKKIRSKVRKI
ncbi:MAG: hypothetical protein ACFFDN_16845 [Candidatus Hodarchaeota archaeon]